MEANPFQKSPPAISDIPPPAIPARATLPTPGQPVPGILLICPKSPPLSAPMPAPFNGSAPKYAAPAAPPAAPPIIPPKRSAAKVAPDVIGPMPPGTGIFSRK